THVTGGLARRDLRPRRHHERRARRPMPLSEGPAPAHLQGQRRPPECCHHAGGRHAMSHTRRIASWVHGLRFEDIPAECIARAKDQLWNILAAIFMSSGHPPSRAAIAGMTLYGSGGPSTVLGTGLTAIPDVAAYLNSFNAQLFEFEDWVNASHAGATV